ncbi:MAG: hypothetical protein J6S58_09365, partial [Lentisphaeria bacterium]|nr:hypothetical protein [Lentisphaeria bacterium]
IHTSFAALQSRLFIVTEEELPAAEVDSGREEVETIRLPEEFEYRAENENLLILDHFRCRLNGTAFNENAEYVLLLDDRLRQALHIPVRNARMVQPWVETAFCGETAEVELMTEFECEVLPEGEVFLALETPEEFRITLNGVEIPSRTDLWYFDHSLKKIILPEKLLREGRNDLVLNLRYDCRFQGLESMYIGGRFGVIPKGVNCCIVKLTPTLHCGDFTEQGFAFYNGSIRCFFPVKRSSDSRFLLKIPVFHGACCKIYCNGKLVKSCLWGPYEADLSSFVSPGGEALVELEIIGSPRNMMGPFFYGEDTLSCCAPRHFKEYHSDHRKLAAFGIA